jgi:HAD superfamily hydrolase (TIGR01549 family)
MQQSLKKLLNDSSTIFWDFDGVIKDSMKVKTSAYKKLFSRHGKKIVDLIDIHHKENGGLSRFEKIPLYLSWTKEPVTKKNVQNYTKHFSLLVKQSVVESPWVPGIKDFLEKNYDNKKFILVTATPKDEIDEILDTLGISNYFKAVYGAPLPKSDALSLALNKFNSDTRKTIMIGDSYSDYEAAKNNKIFFALRKTNLNLALQSDTNCFIFDNFYDE